MTWLSVAKMMERERSRPWLSKACAQEASPSPAKEEALMLLFWVPLKASSYLSACL